MLKIIYTSKFKKDFKLIQKRGYCIDKLEEVFRLLANETPLPEKYCDHALTGEYAEYRDCHIQGDWILIYKIDKNISLISMYRTGTHSDLFK